ncbi:MAG: L-histidine N(alpha)-methyltransferase [Alphaproteobacteria bacterium]|nr:L-histidine N(alpha)-methyltransferase [Alphaproteobacteria bacterium]
MLTPHTTPIQHTIPPRFKPAPKRNDFASAALALFSGRAEGHMGPWEYGPSLYAGDPAGGADLWAELVKNPGAYYLTAADIALTQYAAAHPLLHTALRDIETVVELGPGSHEAMAAKTIPVLRAAPNCKNYIAVDIAASFAADSAAYVNQTTHIRSRGVVGDIFKKPLARPLPGPAAIMMTGGTIANLPCAAGEDPLPHLRQFFANLRRGLKSGDRLIINFDHQNDPQKIRAAYSEDAHRRYSVNALHRLKRDGIINGGTFDPALWRYEPVWIEQTRQCCHTVYPLFAQSVRIESLTLNIPAFQRFVMANSYKYDPQLLSWAALSSGYNHTEILSHGPMSMLIATAS